MTKIGFLLALRDKLGALPKEELEERLSFYSEMIEDRMEDGLSEEAAVADVGSVDEIAAQVVSDVPLVTLVKEKIKPKRQLRTWEILLLAALSPVWFALAVAAVSIAFSLYAALWAVVASLWSVFGALVACASGGLVGGGVFMLSGYLLSGLGTVGAALVCGGLAIFAYFGCLALTKGAVWLTKKMGLGIKLCFARGGQ